MKPARREKQEQRAVARPRGGPALGLELNRLRNEINRLFEDPFALFAPGTSFFEGWTPALDVFDDRDKYVVKAELPGLKKEDINISVEGNTLTISGERKEEEEHRERESYRAERYYGRFQRSLTLPARVDPNKIQANYKDGVLTINVPKSEEARPKQIEVKTS